MKNEHEYIVCSAIWYKELPTQHHLPKNVDRGVVVCGLRHAFIIDVVMELSELRTVKFGEKSVGENVQGFLTNTNRFVDRIEALNIAISRNQVNENELGNPRVGLFSEDLY
jgi:hypothetical protein